MHDRSTRASPSRHRLSGLAAAAAVAAVLCTPDATLALDKTRPQAHPIAIELVQPGREGLELTAHLTEDGGIISQDIEWSIRTPEGETVHAARAGSVDVSLPPGDYLVDVTYGAASVSRKVSLPAASRMMVSFVLKAGGLRVQSRLSEASLPPARPRLRVFALTGGTPGRLVAAQAGTDEMIPLPEGRYRVESRAAAGNAATVADVDIKAGRVSTVGFTVKAGLARLSFVGSPSARVQWNVEDTRGTPVAMQDGLAANLLLTPGTYTARATVGSELLIATFRIAAGETRDIMLGN